VFAVLVAGAAGAGSLENKRADVVLTTRSPIRELAADGKGFAVMTSAVKNDKTVYVVNAWAAPRRKRASFAIRWTSCYHGCGELAVAGDRVAWVEGNGGNSLELYLKTAKLSGGRRTQVDYAANGDGAGEDPEGDWLAEVRGGDSLLAYNRWDVGCTEQPEPGYGCSTFGVGNRQLVRLRSGRPVILETGADVCALAAVGGGRMAVGTLPSDGASRNVRGAGCESGAPGSAGTVVLVAPSGDRVATIGAVKGDPPSSIALSKTRLAIVRSRSLDLYDPATGNKTKTLRVGAAIAQLGLGGVTSNLALLRDSARLVLVRLSDGKRISLPLRRASETGVVDARLTAAGVFYAYNLFRGRTKGRIVLEPTAKLLARF
jgi:hypothetical protein